MKDSWISILIILICIAFIVLGVFNAITYAKIYNENKTVGDVTPGGARALMIINIVICVLFLIPIFVYLRRFYYSGLQGRVFNWVNLFIILGIIGVIILCAFNALTYGKIAAEDKTVGGVTPGGARALMIINILLCTILMIPLIYYIYKMYRTEDAPIPVNLKTEMELGSTQRELETPLIPKVNERLNSPRRSPIKRDFETPMSVEASYNPLVFSGSSDQDDLIEYIKKNIKSIDDADAVYDTICNPFNPVRSSNCDI